MKTMKKKVENEWKNFLQKSALKKFFPSDQHEIFSGNKKTNPLGYCCTHRVQKEHKLEESFYSRTIILIRTNIVKLNGRGKFSLNQCTFRAHGLWMLADALHCLLSLLMLLLCCCEEEKITIKILRWDVCASDTVWRWCCCVCNSHRTCAYESSLLHLTHISLLYENDEKCVLHSLNWNVLRVLCGEVMHMNIERDEENERRRQKNMQNRTCLNRFCHPCLLNKQEMSINCHQNSLPGDKKCWKVEFTVVNINTTWL